MKKELQEIILKLKDTIDKLGMDINEEVIFKESCSFLRGHYAGQNKNNYKQENKNNKPTDKQILFLKKNNIDIPETKQEAFTLIQNKINNQNK